MKDRPDIAALRIMDASANRATEALRVIEDYVRFVLDDAVLVALCKSLRHDLAESLTQLDPYDRVIARETEQDVGTSVTTPQEYKRSDLDQVLRANSTRLRESLRSLEEYAKTFSSSLAAHIESIRYRAYTLDRAVLIVRRSAVRMATVRLYILVDGRESDDAFQKWIERLIVAGVDAIQLREKRLDDRRLLRRARLLRETIERVLSRDATATRPIFIMNDRSDLARLAQADGVHLGQDELSVKEARTILGPDALVGVSTHTLQQVHQAVLDGADYIGVGPVFPSETKQFDHFPGVEFAAAATAQSSLPAFAIGGISSANLDQLLEVGVRRIAIAGATAGAESLENVLADLRRKIETS